MPSHPDDNDDDKEKKKPPHRVVLLVRDGWGYSAEKKGNAIAEANTPHTDSIMRHYYTCQLSGSGETVGLPKGDMVNINSNTRGPLV
jgi:bisphosphoglycerate-independent phosphoglycerate mutase (AlkP superfamily)